MSVLYVILPAALLLGGAAVLAFVWSVRGGQLDDLDTPPLRALFDDEDEAVPPGTTQDARRTKQKPPVDAPRR